MQINTTNQINYSARNPKIRFADDIARKVNQEFPRISPSKMETFANSDNFVEGMEDLWLKVKKMRHNITFKTINKKDFKKIDILFKTIKKKQIGNCGESADLALAIAKMNGIENCTKAGIKSPYGRSFDHAVVLVNDKKPYVIDAWLGFADYVPNTIKKYQTIYRNCFDFKENGERMIVEPYASHIVNNYLSQSSISKLLEAYPHMKIK